MKLTTATPILALAASTLIGLTSCKPSNPRVTGQVFIATQGGAAIRLGAVEVQLIEKQQVTDYIQKKRSEIPAARQEIETAQADCDSFVEFVSNELKPMEEQLEHLRALNARFRDAAEADRIRLAGALSPVMRQRESSSFGKARPLSPSPQKKAGSPLEMAAKAQFRRTQQVKDAVELSALQEQRADNREIARDVSLQCSILGKKAANLFDGTRWATSDAAAYRERANFVGEIPSVKSWREFIDASEKAWPNLRSQIQALREAKERTKAAKESNIAAAKSHLASLTINAFLIADYSPVPIAKANTDADGNFSITYPRNNKYAMFANAQRATLSESEIYYWLIDAPVDPRGARVLLNNNNLVQVDPGGYFK